MSDIEKATMELDADLAAVLKKYAAREYSKGYYAGSMKRWRDLEAQIEKLKQQNQTLMNNQISLMAGTELEEVDNETSRRH